MYRECNPSAMFFHHISKQKSCDANVVTVSKRDLWTGSQDIPGLNSVVAVACCLERTEDYCRSRP